MRSLQMYVIYFNPSDYPGKFVCRKWLINNGKPVPMLGLVGKAHSLEEIRQTVPAGLYRMPRFPFDDIAIKEVWV